MNLPLREFADVVSALRGPGEKLAAAENRRAARMSVSARIDVHVIENEKIGRTFGVLTRDISLNGIGLLQSVALLPGRQVLLALPRTHGGPLFVRALVMQCRTLADDLLAIGLEFVHILDEAAYKRLLSESSSEQARLQRSILD